jgi:hypothetical protein
MKTDYKIATFVLLIVSCFLLGSVPIRVLKTGETSERTIFRHFDGYSIYWQEKQKYRYVGIDKCASVCHNNKEMGFQYDIMKDGPHSKAYIILSSEAAKSYSEKALIKENPQQSAACLKCHITGAGLDSSYFTASYKKEEGVTCEACHKSEFLTKAFLPKETDCLRCHNDSVHKISRFDFVEKCTKIAHPRSGS